MLRRRHLLFLFMRRQPGGNENYVIEEKLLSRFFGCDQVPHVYGVKSAAHKADVKRAGFMVGW